MRPVRGLQLTGLVIGGLSLVYSAVSGDWPSGHSVLVRVLVGTVVGVIIGIALRLAISPKRRHDLIRKAYPRIGARLPTVPDRNNGPDS
jgi:hypothetical protein